MHLQALLLFSIACIVASLEQIEVAHIQGTPGTCPTSEELQRAHDEVATQARVIISREFSPCDGPEWRLVANINMSDPNQDCPSGFTLFTDPIRMCGRESDGDYRCLSTSLRVGASPYSQVCGRIKGYQLGRMFAFYRAVHGGGSFETGYLDGASLSHGNPGARQHIWTFLSAANQIGSPDDESYYFCPEPNDPMIPSFVGNDYFCDSGEPNFGGGSNTMFYGDDPLWDGRGCIDPFARCLHNFPPWFKKMLPDDIELRLCGHSYPYYGQTLVEEIEIYVQ